MIDTSQNMLYHIGNLNDESTRISYQLATGTNMDKGSENSILHSNLIDLDDSLRVTVGLQNQLTKTQVINDVADDSMQELKRLLGTGENTLQTDLEKALNSGTDRSDKLAIATNFIGIRDSMFDRINDKVDGEYVFTGSNTSVQSFEKDDDYALNGKISFECGSLVLYFSTVIKFNVLKFLSELLTI